MLRRGFFWDEGEREGYVSGFRVSYCVLPNALPAINESCLLVCASTFFFPAQWALL